MRLGSVHFVGVSNQAAQQGAPSDAKKAERLSFVVDGPFLGLKQTFLFSSRPSHTGRFLPLIAARP